MDLNHGRFRSLVPHGIRHYEICFDTAKTHSILMKKAILHAALPELPNEDVLRTARLGQAEPLMPWRYFQKSKPTFLMDFPNMSLHKMVMSASVMQHWWRSRTSRFFKLAK